MDVIKQEQDKAQLKQSQKDMKTHNFSAGPAVLANDVLRAASNSALEYAHSGMSILEMSHRSKTIVSLLLVTVRAIRRARSFDSLPELVK